MSTRTHSPAARYARWCLAAFLGLLPVCAGAQSTAAFTRMGFESRGMAMGNALVADVSGHTSPYYNPALAPELTAQHIGFSAAYLRLDRQLQSVALGSPLQPRAGLAVGLLHAGVSNIDGRDNSGFHTGTLSTDEFAFFMAFGLRLTERASAGIALQLFRADLHDLVDPVNSVGLDFGVAVRATDRLTVGAVVEDLLAKYDWDTSSLPGGGGKTTRDQFARRARLGASAADGAGRLRINAEVEFMLESLEVRSTFVELSSGIPIERTESETIRRLSSQFRFGAEYYPSSVFAILAGVDRLGSDALTGAAPTAGFLVEQPFGSLVVRAAYAFVLEPSATGSAHVLTLRVFL